MVRTSGLVMVGLALTGAVAVAADWKPVIEPYLAIQATLAADKTAGVGAKASEVAAAAAKLGETGAPIADAANKLAATTDLEAARAMFMELSEALVKASGAELAAGVRVAYCPMVKKHWLQTGDEIRNPYYGSRMLTCGTFKK